jgi:tetratricopeptide (TPR) repeat protein
VSLRLLALALLLLPSLARADEPPEAIEEARDQYARAQAFYERGQYDAALNAFEHAYATLQLPSLLADIAACQEKLGQDAAAVSTLRRYLKSDAVKDRPLVEWRLGELEARLHPTPAPTPPRPPAPSDETRLRPLRRAVIASGVTTAALAVTASALTLTAATDYRDLAGDCRGAASGCTRDAARRLDRIDIGADVMWAVAGAAAVTTVALHLYLRHERGKLRAAASLRLAAQ